MTYTSLHKGWIQQAGKLFDELEPYDVSSGRDYLANNVAHLADQAGQVRVNVSTDETNGAIDITNVASVGLSPYGRAAVFGPFPLSIRDDGESYRLRVRIRGSTVGGAGTAYYRIVIDQWEKSFDLANLADVTGYHNVKDLSTTSGTDGWITDADPIMWLNSKQVESCSQNMAVADGLGASLFSTKVCLVYMHIFTQASNNWRLSGAYAAEMRGEDS